MNAARIAAVTLAVLVAGRAVHVQQLPPIEREKKPEGYSPLGFEDLRAHEQAFPGDPASLAVFKAAAGKYWVFRGVAYRGNEARGNVWASLGPLSTSEGGASGTGNFSGRVSALAISPTCALEGPCRLWVGAAGGGVWRTDEGMRTDDLGWRWIGHGLGTNSIGALTLDPNDEAGNTIYVGTGETNSQQNSGAGTGLYRSTDGGDHWTRVATNILDTAVSPSPIDFTSTRGISSVAIEPGNPRIMYVGTTTAMLGMTAVRGGQSQITGYPQPRLGLYKTTDAGATWTLIWTPPLDPVIPPNPHATPGQGDTMIGVRSIKLDPRDPHIVYVSAWNNAIHRFAPKFEGGDAVFKPVFAMPSAGRFQDLAMFDLTEYRGHTRVYVYNGTADGGGQQLYRLDNADVAAAKLVSGSGANVLNSGEWQAMSSTDPSEVGSVSFNICGSQCFYDLVVAVPPNRPDTVVLGGVQNALGANTIRSTDGGRRFFTLSSDAQAVQGRSHVDVRAVAFHPRNPDIVFVGSDGGVVRNDGTFRDLSSRCTGGTSATEACRTMLLESPNQIFFLNRGLQTLQFYNVSPDPRAPLQRLLGGLQDNGTVWQDGVSAAGVWKSVFPAGDGTSASGFHPSRSGVVFASFQSNRFFVNFANGDLARWVRTDDPIRAADERATITASTGRQFLSFDEVNPDTQFTGFQHIWRTKNNGGNQAALEASCKFFVGGNVAGTCGDWVPLGVAFPFPAGSNPQSASRRAGDLTADAYGGDRLGGVIVSAERSPLDAGTLWAATSGGRLFVSKNADAAAPDVAFSRIDTPVMPSRFITRIVPDRTDPNAAFISYSGFNALTPSAPGHVFRAVFSPSTRLAAFTSLDRDLGDLPINTLAVDDIRGDIYAGTDYGPLLLRKGSSNWEAAGVGFPEALMVDLKYVPSQRLLIAATHGLGIFYLKLD